VTTRIAATSWPHPCTERTRGTLRRWGDPRPAGSTRRRSPSTGSRRSGKSVTTWGRALSLPRVRSGNRGYLSDFCNRTSGPAPRGARRALPPLRRHEPVLPVTSSSLGLRETRFDDRFQQGVPRVAASHGVCTLRPVGAGGGKGFVVASGFHFFGRGNGDPHPLETLFSTGLPSVAGFR
jgi:hypothetical protein